ncbi:McrB family protein [Ruminococcus flavefaciens]|uniref:McrB family protein n=1 Tax=Ruminococcus flavefaciens TaxID=1265 RepID=UPI00048C662B|nr:AAA family ATPase [Ruminococcus flavefaciens]
MYRKADEEIYKLYDEFITKLFIEKKDFFDENVSNILTKTNLKDCIDNFIINPNEDKDCDFTDKAIKQFEKASENAKRLFSHAIWFWGFSVNESKNCDLVFIENIKKPKYGFANAGLYHSTNKFGEVSFCLRLFDYILSSGENDSDKIKKLIENICLCCAYGEQIHDYEQYKELEVVKTYSKSVSMINILLYLSDPEHYERMVSNGHKQKIVNCFKSLLDEKDKDTYLDDQIYKIREKLSKEIGDKSFDFYNHSKIHSLWNLSVGNEDDDEFVGLKYKKNIVFYGPPGTSKTYSAKELAKTFIARELLSSGKLTMKEYLSDNFNIEKYIYRLQLHANYGYENFIVGQTLVDGKIKLEKGYFLNMCEKAAADIDHPYILILDEINRVDLARLFGEAFSCIENRNDPVDLPYKIDGETLRLCVPENIYIIGTMNEIDFSLERLDFALRRRFLWFKHGYNKDTLFEMLTDINNESDKNYYIDRATALNERICSTRELGEQYEIGHVFFAEIQSILKCQSSKRLYWGNTKSPKDPVNILWRISIQPMLAAYLDNIDVDIKNDIIKELERTFYGK